MRVRECGFWEQSGKAGKTGHQMVCFDERFSIVRYSESTHSVLSGDGNLKADNLTDMPCFSGPEGKKHLTPAR